MKSILLLFCVAFALHSCGNKPHKTGKIEVAKEKTMAKNKAQRLEGEIGPDNNFFGEIKNYDISPILMATEIEIIDDSNILTRPEAIGFIGDDYQRFYIHFTSIRQATDNRYKYIAEGKTRVRGTIRPFKGTLMIKKATIEKDDDMYVGYTSGIAICDVKFYEDRGMTSTGSIFGTMRIGYLIDKTSRLKYNTLYYYADGFNNNSFEGTWTSYKTKVSKKCNWGDFRIPASGDLDIGAGEFSPNSKYFDNGWKSYILSIAGETEIDAAMGKKKESEKWWE